MTERPDEIAPIEPATPEQRAYWEALGHFVHEFSRMEKLLAVVMWQLASVPIPIARAVFSGVRSDEARSKINRLLDVVDYPNDRRKDLTYIFKQIADITKARNSILHYGTEFVEGIPNRTTNEFIAMSTDRIEERPISAGLLVAMTRDLEKITAHLLSHLAVVAGLGPHAVDQMLGVRLRSAWQYTPPQQPVRKTPPPLAPSPKQ